MEEKTINPREQMFIIVSAIILAGLAANYSTPPSIPLARGLARELMDSILKDQKYQNNGNGEKYQNNLRNQF